MGHTVLFSRHCQAQFTPVLTVFAVSAVDDGIYLPLPALGSDLHRGLDQKNRGFALLWRHDVAIKQHRLSELYHFRSLISHEFTKLIECLLIGF